MLVRSRGCVNLISKLSSPFLCALIKEVTPFTHLYRHAADVGRGVQEATTAFASLEISMATLPSVGTHWRHKPCTGTPSAAHTHNGSQARALEIAYTQDASPAGEGGGAGTCTGSNSRTSLAAPAPTIPTAIEEASARAGSVEQACGADLAPEASEASACASSGARDSSGANSQIAAHQAEEGSSVIMQSLVQGFGTAAVPSPVAETGAAPLSAEATAPAQHGSTEAQAEAHSTCALSSPPESAEESRARHRGASTGLRQSSESDSAGSSVTSQRAAVTADCRSAESHERQGMPPGRAVVRGPLPLTEPPPAMHALRRRRFIVNYGLTAVDLDTQQHVAVWAAEHERSGQAAAERGAVWVEAHRRAILERVRPASMQAALLATLDSRRLGSSTEHGMHGDEQVSTSPDNHKPVGGPGCRMHVCKQLSARPDIHGLVVGPRGRMHGDNGLVGGPQGRMHGDKQLALSTAKSYAAPPAVEPSGMTVQHCKHKKGVRRAQPSLRKTPGVKVAKVGESSALVAHLQVAYNAEEPSEYARQVQRVVRFSPLVLADVWLSECDLVAVCGGNTRNQQGAICCRAESLFVESQLLVASIPGGHTQIATECP
jgi:hypothetical protein